MPPEVRQILDTTDLPWTVADGGTGQTVLSPGDLLYADATDSLSLLSLGSAGQVLTVVGSVPAWATPAGGGATALDDLTDVTITGPITGQYLRKSATDWVNSAIQASDLPSHSHVEADITDLDHYTSTDFATDFGSADLADLGTRAHSSLTNIGTDDHHARDHAIDGATHTASGLTSGHFLKATGATTFAFAAHGLTYSDVGAAAASHTHAASAITSGTLAVARGGTNIGSYTTGDLIYASGSTTLTKLAVGTSAQALKGGTTPAWGAVAWTEITGKPSSFEPAAHALIDGYHTASGLTVGHVLQATAANDFAFGAITSDMLPVIGVDQGGTGNTTYTDGEFLCYVALDGKIESSGYDQADFALAGHTHVKADITDTPWAWSDVSKTGSSLADLATRSHADLTDVTANQHHARDHVLATASGLGSTHTVSGLTAGQYLRATGATSAAFQSIPAGDLPSHTHSTGDITSGVFGVARGGTGTTVYVDGEFLIYDNIDLKIISSGYDESDFASASHTHPLSELEQSGATTGQLARWSGSAWQPSSTLPSHTHAAGDITSGLLAIARGGSSNATYTTGDLLEYDGSKFASSGYSPSDFAADDHTHPASDIVSGTFDDARIAQSNVTQHEAALSIGASQITGTLAVGHGGTGTTVYVDGEFLVYSTIDGRIISSGYDQADFAANDHTHPTSDIVSGTFGVARGGTGLSTWTAAGRLLYSTGATALATLAHPGATKFLRASGTSSVDWADVTWGDVTGKPSGFTPSAHPLVDSYHTASGLTTGHILKATASNDFDFGPITTSMLPTVDVAHGGTGNTTYTDGEFVCWSSVDGKIISSGYDEGDFASASHTHAASDITSGTFADARIAESNVTQHQAAIDHGSIAGLGDDDHTQYLLAAGTRALTGDWDAGAFDIRAAKLTADTAEGVVTDAISEHTADAGVTIEGLQIEDGMIEDHLLPFTDDTYDLGSAAKSWQDLYLDGTVYIGADCNLYRNGANQLKTNDSFEAAGGLRAGTTSYFTDAYFSNAYDQIKFSNPTNDVYWMAKESGNKAFAVYQAGTGFLAWVTDDTHASPGALYAKDYIKSMTGYLYLGADTSLYRNAANELKTDDSLIVGGSFEWGGGQQITDSDSVWTGCDGGEEIDKSTAAGDLLRADGAGGWQRMARGGADQVLAVNALGSDLVWTDPAVFGGDVSASGVPVDNQIAVWVSDSEIEGDSKLTWDGTYLWVDGYVEIDNVNGNSAFLSADIAADDVDHFIEMGGDTAYLGWDASHGVVLKNTNATYTAFDIWSDGPLTIYDKAGAQKTGHQIDFGATDYYIATDTNEMIFSSGYSPKFTFGKYQAAAFTTYYTIDDTAIYPEDDNTRDCGTATKRWNEVFALEVDSGAGSLTLSSAGDIVCGNDFVSDGDGTRDLGTAANQWANVYADDVHADEVYGGSLIADGPTVLSSDAAVIDPTSATAAIRLSYDTAYSPVFEAYKISGAALLDLYNVPGSYGSFSAISSGNHLGRVQFGGYDGTNYVLPASVIGAAEENWSDGNNGARLTFRTTPNNSSTAADRWHVKNDGDFLPAADASYDIGQSDKRVQELYVGTIDSGAASNLALQYNDSTKLEVASGGIDVTGEARCDSLRIDTSVTADTWTAEGYIVVSINGTNYRIGVELDEL